MKLYKLLFIVLFLSQLPVFAQKSASDLEDLYRNKHYFELRDALSKIKNDKRADVLFYRAAVANKFNRPETSTALLRKFLKSKKADKKKQVEALQMLADNYTKTYEYGRAADAYRKLTEDFKTDLSDEETKSFKNVGGLWHALRGVRPQKVSVEKDTLLAGTRDKAKLLNIPVEIGDQKMDFVFDTGANLSTITASTAARLGLKIIEADVSVGSSTDRNVRSKLAVAPEMRIGDILVKNVVFLVMEDKSLYIPQIDYQINAILGFPVIKSLGEITLSRGDTVLVSKKRTIAAAEPNMLLDGLLPLVAGRYKGRRMIFVFDTGANGAQLYAPFYEAETEAIKKASAPQKVKFGGAGGSIEVTAHKLKDLELEIGGRTARFPEITVTTEKFNNQSRYYYGNLGQSLIKQFERMTLDFGAMRLAFE